MDNHWMMDRWVRQTMGRKVGGQRMNGQINMMGGWVGGYVNRQHIDRQTIDEWIDGQWMDEGGIVSVWVARRINGQMNGWMDDTS